MVAPNGTTRPQFQVTHPLTAVYRYVDLAGEPFDLIPGREYDVIGTTVEVRRDIPWITFTVSD